MLLSVGAGRRRAGLTGLAAQGSLAAGASGWLGVAIAPLADPLPGAHLQLSPLQSPGGFSGPFWGPSRVQRPCTSGSMPFRRCRARTCSSACSRQVVFVVRGGAQHIES